MLPLGLLLVIAAGAVGVAVAMHNTDPATLAAFGESYDMTVLGVFLIGAVTGIGVMAGFSLMIGGALSRRDRRAAHVHDIRTENEQLADENARLRAQANDPYPIETSSTQTGKHTVT